MIKLTLTTKQAEFLRAVLQNPLLNEPADIEPTGDAAIREELWTWLDDCLNGLPPSARFIKIPPVARRLYQLGEG